jgi:hypothetical protein
MEDIIVVGIDPGLKGGIACLKNGEILTTAKMPIVKNKVGSRVDAVALTKIIKDTSPSMVIIEEPQVRAGENIIAHLTIGINFGIIYATLTMLRVKFITIPAVVWTHAIHSLITGSKEWETHPSKMKSLKTFRKLYPESQITHDGIVDAVLIAFYWLWKEGFLAKIKKSTNRG